LPKLTTLTKKFANEIDRRELVEAKLEAEATFARREEARMQDEERAAEEKRQRIKHSRKLQKQAAKEAFQDPVLGPIYRAELEKELMKKAAVGGRRSNSFGKGMAKELVPKSPQSSSQHDEADDEDDPFADDFPAPMSEFPTNNKRDSPQEWQDSEVASFIDIMRAESGPDRYEIAAQKVGRSMEEIFRFAKEFQQDMDDYHEKGELNEECDAWTYEIWEER